MPAADSISNALESEGCLIKKEPVLAKETIMGLCTTQLILAILMLILLVRELFITQNPLISDSPLKNENMETVGNIVDRDVIQINPNMLVDLLISDPLFARQEKDDQMLEVVQKEKVDVIFQRAVSSMLRRTVEGQSLPKSMSFLRRALSTLEKEARAQQDDLAAKAEDSKEGDAGNDEDEDKRRRTLLKAK
ncbi:unnamed protein product [Dibothriocephalus latus]|uniref:Uncharacterized protein n=1 Tax=Dibothriocephalus latus TaxID=60516 RepID=A0A3P7RHZ4_DIBLA|nr:unnamed protein product [Dibothriocephalus latus]